MKLKVVNPQKKEVIEMKKYMVIAVTAFTLAFPALSHAADEMKEGEMMESEQMQMQQMEMMTEMNQKLDQMMQMMTEMDEKMTKMEEGQMMEKK